ncbi:hypothetical protein HC248_00288 [Polaromonas vacuolata]|uniref:Polysaccharide chain length determinant N-terminal domain-containing protein n=1 Tax=Polaromonas vacuolata TaxID=37448 RepID=A0A6H2H5A1_9BURK|nr:Wzz/FepE/Etk N-terminal domain-containing protein [Polaromonas vacuolata]QJC55025.1 hypothetical protein HC248_00288 [Polaromonas vacuolata]
MEKNHNSTLPFAHVEQNEVSLLDILLTLAENAKLLIIGSLLAGLITLGISYTLPQTFESVAVIQADQTTASLMTTAAVLDPVIAQLGLSKDESVEFVRNLLRQKIKTAVGRNDKLLTLTVSALSPEQAQAIALALLQQIYLLNRPQGSVRARLESQLIDAQARFTDAGNVAANLRKKLESSSVTAVSSNDQARGYAELLNVAALAKNQISVLQVQLEGVNEAQLVQSPTLASNATQSKKALMAVSAVLVASLFLLLFIFMRQTLRRMVKDTDAIGKLARIRSALGLK